MRATPIPDEFAAHGRRIVFTASGNTPEDTLAALDDIQPVEGLVVAHSLAGRPWAFAWFRFELSAEDLAQLAENPTVWVALTHTDAGILPFTATLDPPV